MSLNHGGVKPDGVATVGSWDLYGRASDLPQSSDEVVEAVWKDAPQGVIVPYTKPSHL